jgi:hypothetical protein
MQVIVVAMRNVNEIDRVILDGLRDRSRISPPLLAKSRPSPPGVGQDPLAVRFNK